MNDTLKALNVELSKRKGPIVTMHVLSEHEVAEGIRYPEFSFYHEQSISNNTTAAGGNASLMTID